MRRLSIMLAIVFGVLASGCGATCPWQLAGTTVTTAHSMWDIGSEQLPADAAEAIAAIDTAFDNAPALLTAWESVGDQPEEWAAWVAGIHQLLDVLVVSLLAGGVDVPQWVEPALIGVQLVLGLLI